MLFRVDAPLLTNLAIAWLSRNTWGKNPLAKLQIGVIFRAWLALWLAASSVVDSVNENRSQESLREWS